MGNRVKAGVVVVYSYASDLMELSRTLYSVVNYNIPHITLLGTYPDRVCYRYIRELVDMGVLVVIGVTRGNTKENTRLERFVKFRTDLINDIGKCNVSCVLDLKDLSSDSILNRMTRESNMRGIVRNRDESYCIEFDNNITASTNNIFTKHRGSDNPIDHLYYSLFSRDYTPRYNSFRKPIVVLSTTDYVGVEMTESSDFTIEALRNNKISYIKVDMVDGVIKHSIALYKLFKLYAKDNELLGNDYRDNEFRIYYAHTDGTFTSCKVHSDMSHMYNRPLPIQEEIKEPAILGVEISSVIVSRHMNSEKNPTDVAREWLTSDGDWTNDTNKAKLFTCKKELLLAITKDEYIDSDTGNYKLMFTHFTASIRKAELEVNVKLEIGKKESL